MWCDVARVCSVSPANGRCLIQTVEHRQCHPAGGGRASRASEYRNSYNKSSLLSKSRPPNRTFTAFNKQKALFI